MLELRLGFGAGTALVVDAVVGLAVFVEVPEAAVG